MFVFNGFDERRFFFVDVGFSFAYYEYIKIVVGVVGVFVNEISFVSFSDGYLWDRGMRVLF